MAIKKVRFVIQKSSFAYTAFGGVRFYKSEVDMVNSGSQVSASPTSGETQNFLATSDAGYPSTNAYYLPYLVDTNKKQTGVYTDLCYWLTDSANATYTITVEFKVPLDKIYKIEFVPRPDTSTIGANRGIDKPFMLELIDENNKVLIQPTINPTTQLNTIQTCLVPPLIKNKILLSSGDDKYYSILSEIATENYLPPLTGNITEYAEISASSVANTTNNDAWKAFDGDSSTFWSSASVKTGALAVKLKRKVFLGQYVVGFASNVSVTATPKDWTFEGSSDGVNWTVIDTQINQTWGATEKRVFKINRLEGYDHYRLNITANNGNTSLILHELSFNERRFKEVGIDNSTENTFLKYGVNDKLLLNANLSGSKFLKSASATLGSGKSCEHTIDMSKRRVDKITLG